MKPGETFPLTRLFGRDGQLTCPVCGIEYTHPRVDPTAAHLHLDESNSDPQIRLTFDCENGHRSELFFRSHAGLTTATVQYNGERDELGERPEESWRPARGKGAC